ncbi:MAG: DNA repair protein RecN [Alphaproteobacteria bacterium]|nr:DNA repair protein RecN [Alphaproteobacteria bacterium]
MLTSLHISNIVLIDKLNLEFGAGLNILTGETGAGKSILLDALSLALGGRADTGLIRNGTDTASVIAEFDSVNDSIKNILNEFDIDINDDLLILRRTIGTDGKSRAWVNDVPVSVKTLKSIGDELVEVHGQFANHALLNPVMHRVALDDFASKNIDGFDELSRNIHDSYHEYTTTLTKLHEIEDFLAKSAAEQEYLEHNVAELRALNVQIGEEEELSSRRNDIINAQKNIAILNDASAAMGRGGDTLDAQIFAVAHILERIKTDPNPYSEQIDTLYNAAEMVAKVSEQITADDIDTDAVDSIEERLFAIRAAARKHRVSADELPNKLTEMEKQLNIINNSDLELQKIKSATENAKHKYDEFASKMTGARTVAAKELRDRILRELPDLKLANADFNVELSKTTPSVFGHDDIVFMIKTNPGMPFAPLHKSASGGELARLMLALRVVLAGENAAHTFVFDEVDTGISGATASAVGSRLNRLANGSQALVITHSAQVAGFADKHFKIEKKSNGATTTTNVYEITGDDRLNEIARIISGAKITPESLATAKTLLK